MTCFVKFTHLEQTLFVHFHQLCYSLKKCLELFLRRRREMSHYGMLPRVETNKQTSILEDKKKVEMMDVSTSVVLSHFHIVSMLLSVLKINLAPFCKRRL